MKKFKQWYNNLEYKFDVYLILLFLILAIFNNTPYNNTDIIIALIIATTREVKIEINKILKENKNDKRN